MHTEKYLGTTSNSARQVAAPPVAAPSLAPPVRTVRELEGALNSRGTLPASPEEGALDG